MHSYRFFVQRPDGAFGAPRTVDNLTDDEALKLAFELAAAFGGCDLWRGKRRVAFLSMGPAGSSRQAA